MEKLLKEMQERLKFLESEEQTDDIKSRKDEIVLAIIRVQQRILENMFCKCSHPQNTYDGTQRCTYCLKKLPLKFSPNEQQNNLLTNKNKK
jgi:hypothetical protein